MNKLTLEYSKDYILENEVVKLMPLQKEHVEGLMPLARDPNIWTYFLEKGCNIQQLTNYIQNALNSRAAKKEYPFVVFDKRNNKIAGTTRFYEFNQEIKTIKLGHTWYGTEFQGTGINKHCKYLLFEFAFEKLGVERIGFGSYITNLRSIAAMESVGCKKEGILRNMFPAIVGEGRTDAILLSILKNEWESEVKTILFSKLCQNSNISK